MTTLADIRTYVTSVARVEQVTPCTRRITVAGGDLARFPSAGADQFVYVLLPPPGRDTLTVGADFTWEQYRKLPEDERPVGAYYTVRSFRPATDRGEVEIDLDFVLHGDDGAGSAFASRARPGDPVALWGPRVLHEPPAGADTFLLVADDTAVPALSVLVESYPAGSTVVALAEVDGPEEERPVVPGDGVSLELRWLHRRGVAPGRSSALVDAVRALGPVDPGTYCWGGGETQLMSAVRDELRARRGLAADQVCMTGYWTLSGPA